MKISSMKYLVGQGIKNVWVNRVMSFASFCVLMVSLLLVGFTVLITMNINRFISGIENKNEIIMYLNDDTSDDTISKMENIIRGTSNVAGVSFYSKEQAWEDTKADYENADDLFSYFDESPLPDAFKIKVSDVSQMQSTISRIESAAADYNAILKIKSPDDFAEILTSLKSTLTMVSTAILVALAVVSMVIISNATRASIFSRKIEINIMKYVGATNTFIKVPFFIEGMFTGMLAGGVASVITWLVYEKLIDTLSQEMTLWKALGVSEFIPYDSLWLKVTLCYVIAAAFFGALGSVFSTRKYLRV